MTPETAAKSIEDGRLRDEFAYVEAVGHVLDRANALRWWPWQRAKAIRLYQIVADLDIDDDFVALAVDEARCRLECWGIPCEPSSRRTYETRLTAMPAHQRHLTSAKQALTAAASGGPRRKQKKLLSDALRHFQLAEKHGSLSKQDQRVVAGESVPAEC